MGLTGSYSPNIKQISVCFIISKNNNIKYVYLNYIQEICVSQHRHFNVDADKAAKLNSGRTSTIKSAVVFYHI